MRQSCQQQQKECSCAGTVEAIINADTEGNQHTEQNGSVIAVGYPFRVQTAASQHIQSSHRQDEQHENLDAAFRQQQSDSCANIRAAQSEYHTRQRTLPVNETAFSITISCHHRTHGSTHFIGGNGAMDRHTGNHISRQGNEPAAASHCVYESRHKNHGAYDQIRQKRIHNCSFSFVILLFQNSFHYIRFSLAAQHGF